MKAPSVPVVKPADGRFHRYRAGERAGDRLRSNAGDGGVGADPGDGARTRLPSRMTPPCLLSEVTVLPAASWIVAVSTRLAPEVRLVVAPREDDVGGGTVDDGERAEARRW